MVETRVQHVLRSAELSFDRKSYYDFTDIERAEAINDDNANGECDAGETFEDENGNGSWAIRHCGVLTRKMVCSACPRKRRSR